MKMDKSKLINDWILFLYNQYDELEIVKDYVNNISEEIVYDLYGNIISKTIKDITGVTTINQFLYEYDNDWADCLVKYDNKTITYDQIGNPINIGKL